MKSCPICVTSELKPSIAKFGLNMKQCKACSLVFTESVPEDSNNRYATDWFEMEYLPSFGIDPKNPQTGHLAERFDADLVLIEQSVNKGRILDVGAGAGLLLNQAKKRGWQVFGVEPSAYGVDFARRIFDIEMFQGVLKDAILEEASFDAVILQDVLEHVTDPVDVLKDVRRLLKNRGVVLITTPNYGAISRTIYRSNWSLISPAEHVSLFTNKALKAAFKKSDIKIASIKSTSEIETSRIHFNNQPFLKYRKYLLKCISKILPSSLVKNCVIGDELVALGSVGR